MTRETKIGLLMGLGFIVVFAVLLSHTTDFGRPPVGDNISIMAGHDDGAADLVGGVSGPAIVVGNPGPDTASSDFALAGSDVPELPEFPGMEAAETFEGVSGPSPDVPALAQRSEDIDPVEFGSPRAPSPVSAEVVETVAVAGREPPIFRAEDLKITAVSDENEGETPSTPVESESTHSTIPVAAQEYVVQKGETLGKIAKRFYDTASPKVVQFLVQSNRQEIRDKDFVREGQKLRIPDLPPDLFEPAEGFAPARLSESISIAASGETSSPSSPPTGRQAPSALHRVAEGDIPDMPDTGFRWYVVQPKDTFSTIARKELGSSQHWKEIQRLNKDVEPRKMRPGVKLRLPKSPPLSDAAQDMRASA